MDTLDGVAKFEDLSIDDNISQLQRVVKYSHSGIALQRLVHVKMLAETASVVGYEETVASIVPLFEGLVLDSEYVVRQHLAEQLQGIAKMCAASENERGYSTVTEVILPTVARLLKDVQSEVRQAAGDALVGVASLMRPSDLGQYVLTVVLQLAHEDEQEELRMTAAGLLNDLAECLGPDLCKQFVTPEMVSLSEDPVFRVRKATALNLHNPCRVVGQVDKLCVMDRLLPAFERLTKDDMYRVRKACTESLVEVSKAVGMWDGAYDMLTEMWTKLASDNSKIVRNGALQHLGPFISTLPKDLVSVELVGHFTGPTVAPTNTQNHVDSDMLLYCAFSFPAVVLTLGPERWPELREAFKRLSNDSNWNVRKTLSHSLHEVANVLDTEAVEEDLVPQMEAFLRDVEEVRVGVIRSLADIYAQMSAPCREQHLHILGEVLEQISPFNWRLREVLALQLPRLLSLFSPDSTFTNIVPVAFLLLADPVSEVRERTFEAIAPLLDAVGDGNTNSSAASGSSSRADSSSKEEERGERLAVMISRVREFAHASTFQMRQMYIFMCQRLAFTIDRALFQAEFLSSLAELAFDRVINVRIAMSRTLGKCPEWLVELPEMQRAVRVLSADPNKDIVHFISFLPDTLRLPTLGEVTGEELRERLMETSSVVSDESTRTAWSLSTVRSDMNVEAWAAAKILPPSNPGSTSVPNGGAGAGYDTDCSSSSSSSSSSTSRADGKAAQAAQPPPPPPPPTEAEAAAAAGAVVVDKMLVSEQEEEQPQEEEVPNPYQDGNEATHSNTSLT